MRARSAYTFMPRIVESKTCPSDSSDFFDIRSFVDGGKSPYINPRRQSYDQGYKNPITGSSISIWDLLSSFIL